MTPLSGTVREPTWSDVVLWFETIDAIVRGLGHGLNNRALALGATIESLDPKRPVGQHLASGLTRETERLTDQLRQLRALPFAIEREPMPLLLRDVLSTAIQLHRAHASLGEIPAYLETSSETPPVLAPESALMHAALVTLTALKAFASPGGIVRITCSGHADQAEVTFVAQRDPTDAQDDVMSRALIKPTALTAALLSSAQLEIEQQIGPDAVTLIWTLPSLKAMRRRTRELAAAR
jgi:hypothetical protein